MLIHIATVNVSAYVTKKSVKMVWVLSRGASLGSYRNDLEVVRGINDFSPTFNNEGMQNRAAVYQL